MKESELIKLLTVIGNVYSNFSFDRMKTALWLELLKDVPYARAESNLRRYIMDPDNKFAPHPGALAATRSTIADGPAVPNADDTRRLLEEMERRALAPVAPIPNSVREAVLKLAEPKPSDPRN